MHALQPLVAQRGLGLSGRVPSADWQGAVRRVHDMYTKEIPWSQAALLGFAEASSRFVREEFL